MNYNRRQQSVYVMVYEAKTEDGKTITIDSHGGYAGKVCEWVVWPDDGSKPLASGVCYGVKQAKQAAEQAAEVNHE